MAKQTAVQWLVMTYNQRQGYIRFEDIDIANKMFEEQIIESRNNGIVNTLKGYSISSEEYYNEVYAKSN